MKYTLVIFIPLLFLLLCGFQIFDNYKFKKTHKGCLILYKGNLQLDTICLTTYKGFDLKRNQILQAHNKRVVSIEFKVGAIDNFSKSFYKIQEWTVDKDKFLFQNSLKIPLNNCHVRKLKFYLTDKGVKWSYRKSIFNRQIGLILFKQLKEQEEYSLPCSLE